LQESLERREKVVGKQHIFFDFAAMPSLATKLADIHIKAMSTMACIRRFNCESSVESNLL
jgi:hypothetical protein